MAPEFRAEAVFADMIRREDTGKLLLVGLYANDMALPPGDAPAIPLQCLFTLRGPLGRMPARLALEVRLGDQVLARVDVQPQPQGGVPPAIMPGPAALMHRAADLGASSAAVTAQAELAFILPPIGQDEVLAAWADLGDGLHPVGTLLIHRAPPPA